MSDLDQVAGRIAELIRSEPARAVTRYDAAFSNLENAMRCYEKAGLTAEWDKTVSQVRAEHHRKTGFMSGFERLVAGSAPSDQPSFLERAKASWGKRHGEDAR